MKTTTALIEKGRDGLFSIFTPDLSHTIIGSGKTVAEAKVDFMQSFSEMQASYTETEREIPEELTDIQFEYKYDLASLFNYYKWINVSKFAELAGINASLMRQYKTGGQYISESQIAKIETALRNAGKEIATISLV